MKELLLKNDLKTLKELKERNINVSSLKHLLSRINNNTDFKNDEKEYLKKILVSNINNAFKIKA